MKKNIYTIIIIHGSNYKSWIIFFKKLLKKINKKIFYLNKIFISFINKNKTYLIKIIKNGLKNSIINYLVIPLFLSKGKHVKVDLKKIIHNTLKIYKKIKFYNFNIIEYKNNLIKLLKKNYIKKIKKIIINL